MRAVVIAAMIGVAAPAAAAPARVVVVGAPGQPPRATLVAALRVQLHGSAEVEVGASLPVGPLGDRLAAAAGEVERRAATIAVWAESAPAAGDGATDVVLYAVTARGDRGLVEVGRVPAGAGAALDRVLALKVAALLDDLAAAAEALPSASVLGGVVALRPPRRATSWAAVVDAGGGFLAAEAGGSGQGYVALGAGARWSSNRFGAGLLAVGRTYDVAYFGGEAGRGRVVVDAIDAGACVELGVAIGERSGWQRVRLRAAAELAARRLAVRGSTADGGRGDATLWTSAARGSLGIEVRLGSWPLAVGVRVGSDDAIGTRRFTVDGDLVAEVGGGRTFAELMVRGAYP